MKRKRIYIPNGRIIAPKYDCDYQGIYIELREALRIAKCIADCTHELDEPCGLQCENATSYDHIAASNGNYKELCSEIQDILEGIGYSFHTCAGCGHIGDVDIEDEKENFDDEGGWGACTNCSSAICGICLEGARLEAGPKSRLYEWPALCETCGRELGY